MTQTIRRNASMSLSAGLYEFQALHTFRPQQRQSEMFTFRLSMAAPISQTTALTQNLLNIFHPSLMTVRAAIQFRMRLVRRQHSVFQALLLQTELTQAHGGALRQTTRLHGTSRLTRTAK